MGQQEVADAPPGRRQIVGAVFHLADREPYSRLNDVVCVCAGEVRTPGDPGQPGPDLVVDVAELAWDPSPNDATAGCLLPADARLVASALFAVYIANFSHCNKVYGSLAGVIIFLIWMWISNVAILPGAEFNAELERGRAVAGGHPAGQAPFSELRDDRKLRKKDKQSRS